MTNGTPGNNDPNNPHGTPLPGDSTDDVPQPPDTLGVGVAAAVGGLIGGLVGALIGSGLG